LMNCFERTIIAINMAKKEIRIYSVSQINSFIKAALEEKLPTRVIVAGEISDWKHHTSGHCYFSLKDENTVLGCVMWKSSFAKVTFEPANGMAVLATGHIDVYPPQGKYQLYVDKLQPEGKGALRLAFEQMYAKLLAEGLFKDEYKKPLPPYPCRIGILTSESAAAVQDIIDSIHNRFPCVKLFLYPVPVQGEGAARKIASAIRDVNIRNKQLRLDIIIVGRGGGALEDLWAFNEEVLARAIFDSEIPVISAVGHEIDITIADLVADVRASTPTKAGVVAVPDVQEVSGQLAATADKLKDDIKAKLKLAQQNLETILASAVFRNPLFAVRSAEQQLDEISAELAGSIKNLLTKVREKLHKSYEKIVTIEPHRLLKEKTISLSNLRNRTNTAMQAVINNCRMQLTAKENRLAGLNPKLVLKRGYSITTNKETGLLVRSPADVKIGDLLVSELENEKLIESKVTKK